MRTYFKAPSVSLNTYNTVITFLVRQRHSLLNQERRDHREPSSFNARVIGTVQYLPTLTYCTVLYCTYHTYLTRTRCTDWAKKNDTRVTRYCTFFDFFLI